MFRKIVTYVIVVPVAIVVLMFAFANREIVTVSFDPFNQTQPAFSVTMPMFVWFFALVILGIVIGGIAMWFGQARYRRAARYLEGENRRLHHEIENLQSTRGASAPGDAARISYSPPTP
jgi:uncharacterized integral membrane protein